MSRKLRASLERITDADTAARIVRFIDGDEDPRSVPETDAWVRACYHEPGADEQALHAADVLLGTYGVEGWASDDGRSGVSYCNAGDTYEPTLFLVRGRFRVSDLGTAVGH
jgi:hypothetical protein